MRGFNGVLYLPLSDSMDHHPEPDLARALGACLPQSWWSRWLLRWRARVEGDLWDLALGMMRKTGGRTRIELGREHLLRVNEKTSSMN